MEVAQQASVATQKRVPLKLLLRAIHESTSRNAAIRRSISARVWTSVKQ